MRSLWQRFIQNIFGKSDPLQGEWLGWQDDNVACLDPYCSICDDYESCDIFEE